MASGLDPVGDRSNTGGVVNRLWTFLAGIVTSSLKLTSGASSGAILRADSQGNASWGFGASSSKASVGNTTSATDTLAVTPGAGEYLITAVLNVTTAATAGTIGASVTFTDDVGSTTPNLFTGFSLTGTGRTQASYVLRLASGSIDYTVTVAGVLGSPLFNFYIHALRLR